MKTRPVDRPWSRAVLAAVGAVVIWRLAVLVTLVLTAQPLGSLVVQTLLAAAGLTFLVHGLVVYLKIPGKASLLFVAFCICSGLHWGGYLELQPGGLRTGIILVYLLLSGILGSAFFLHLGLEFPRKLAVADSKVVVGLLYLPVLLAAMLAAASQQDAFLMVHTVVTNLFPFVVLVIFVVHLARGGKAAGHRKYVGLMVAGMLAAWLPYMIASALGVADTDPWNLTVALLPLSFAMAFLGMRGDSAEAPE